ncbi:IucA/IucC family protein [Streptomyces sp. NPDC101132]|uniref:IucA/IucC family protein n=1 Tax=Streptomyces sp. NPDC101132 TaxID=3366110 RepID=UPI003823422B
MCNVAAPCVPGGQHVIKTAAERSLAAELREVRPDLLGPYADALPGARAAVLSRLWRGLVHDPLPWVAGRGAAGGAVVLRLVDGRRLSGPPRDPWATAPLAGPVELEGVPYDHPALLLRALGVPRGEDFAAELDGSVASLALSRTAGADGTADGGSDGAPGAAWEWEQRVTDGHPYHPGCRSRPGFTAAEQLAYAPEHRQVVGLPLVPVTEPVLVGRWPRGLRDGERVLVPVHPWQAAHVLKEPVRGPLLAARPLLSLRTLEAAGEVAGAGTALHVKTALSTRLTSSVRDISAYSVENAAVLSEFVEAMAARLEGRLHVTRTVAAVGAPAPDLAAVLREAPDVYADRGAGERVVPVACLAEFVAGTVPAGERRAWREAFAGLVLEVGLRLLGLGVALEAHGQNLLLVVDAAGRPARLVYRDLADIRISPARLARHGIPLPPLTARQQTDDPVALRRKLFGGLLSGALGPLAGDTETLGTLLAAGTAAMPCGDDLHALTSEPLPVKALTLMRLSEAGGDQWTGLPNPLAGG